MFCMRHAVPSFCNFIFIIRIISEIVIKPLKTFEFKTSGIIRNSRKKVHIIFVNCQVLYYYMVLLQNCIEYVNLTDLKDEIKMLVLKLKNQNLKFNKLKTRIPSFIRS